MTSPGENQRCELGRWSCETRATAKLCSCATTLCEIKVLRWLILRVRVSGRKLAIVR